MSANRPPCVLITIPISHYCEKARWALERAGVPYRERAHMQLIHRVAVRRAGGGTTVPVLVCGPRVLAESADIVDEANAKAPPGRRLYPDDPVAAAEVRALERDFDERLGPHGRRWMYNGLRGRRDIAVAYACTGVPAWERHAFRIAYPVMARGIDRFLDITPATALQSEGEVRAVFDSVGQRLGDGRPYLCGERFTAADLTFAALAAAVVMPPEYGVPLPQPDELPAAMAGVVRELRAHPAGTHALAMFRDERRPAGTSSSATHDPGCAAEYLDSVDVVADRPHGPARSTRVRSVGRSLRYLGGMGIAAVAAAMLVPASVLAADRFTSGVTAGEVTSSSAIVWARTSRQASVQAQVATDAGFQNVVRQRTLQASAATDDTVQTTFGALNPNTTYHYQFCFASGNPCSSIGKFVTAPSPSTPKTIRFAYSGDETGVSAPGQTNPFWGDFKAFKTMVGEHNDFNIDFGDTIYSDPEVPGANTATTVRQKWNMYLKKLALPNMQSIRSSTGLYNHWDDHEFINDFSVPENGRPLYDRSVKAFRTYEPVTFSKDRGIYRSVRWGKNLQLFFLDERSFRSSKASANHVCDNPDTGQPDLAPTAPENVRNAFAALVPSLSQPVSQACKDKINSPGRSFLGGAQLTRFVNDVKSSNARWKVVMNETPIQQFYALPYDRWEGYATERVRLLRALQTANVNHLVFLTTDTHAALANVVRYRTLQGDVAPANAPLTAPSNTPYQDFVIGPVGTKPFWQEIDDTTGRSGNGKVISNAFFKPPPPNGMGMACAQGGANSYGEVTVTGSTLRIAYKDENGNILKDSDGTTPCGPYVLTH